MNVLNRLKGTFEIPFDPSDENTNRASVVSGLLNLVILLIAIYIIPAVILRGIYSVQSGIVCFLLMVFALLRFAVSKGYSRISSFAMLFVFWAATVYLFIWIENGVRAPAYTASLAFILSYAGLLHGRRVVWLIAGATLLINVSVVLGEMNGYYLTEPKIPDVQLSVMGQIVFGSGMIYILNKTLQNLGTSIARFRTESANRLEAETNIRMLNKELEERMDERETIIEELGRKNAELEQFTYTVSHELKSPIVTIKNYLDIMNKDVQQKKYESMQRDIQRVLMAADKMHATLLDILELSRVGRVANPNETIDVGEIVQEAIEIVAGRLQIHSITVNVAPKIPSVYGDRMRLRAVFENLIDNAAKYMGGQVSPTINIGVRNGDNPIFFVSDNGMGIEAQYQSRIFDLFEKLDPTSDGTGVGLTFIKRIIEVHGGKMWVESEGLGKGTTFCFTIPDKL
jgi:signal transduction histidine kinase